MGSNVEISGTNWQSQYRTYDNIEFESGYIRLGDETYGRTGNEDDLKVYGLWGSQKYTLGGAFRVKRVVATGEGGGIGCSRSVKVLMSPRSDLAFAQGASWSLEDEEEWVYAPGCCGNYLVVMVRFERETWFTRRPNMSSIVVYLEEVEKS